MGMQVYPVGEHYNIIAGPARDEFINDIMDMRDQSGDNITLDLSGVDRLSSIALAAIGRLHTWMEEHERVLLLINVSDSVQQLFDLTGLSEMLNISDSTEILPTE